MGKSKGLFEGRRILVGVTGGIAAYKGCELVRRLSELGAEVRVMMSRAAQEFVTPLTFQTLSGNPVQTELFNLTEEQKIGHIDLADWAELIVIAPATADFLAKSAHGMADDIVTTVLLATKAQVLLAPSMNVQMWENPITQENVAKLKRLGQIILDPAEGPLACGYEGKGRLPDPEVILTEMKRILTKGDLRRSEVLETGRSILSART